MYTFEFDVLTDAGLIKGTTSTPSRPSHEDFPRLKDEWIATYVSRGYIVRDLCITNQYEN